MASKTDVKCTWLKHPKSAPPKSTVTSPSYKQYFLKCPMTVDLLMVYAL